MAVVPIGTALTRDKQDVDVGRSIAIGILDDGRTIVITVDGQLIDPLYSHFVSSAHRLATVMNGQWVLADDGVNYNRRNIRSYTVTDKPHRVPRQCD